MKNKVLDKVSRVQALEVTVQKLVHGTQKVSQIAYRRVHAEARKAAKAKWDASQRWRAVDLLKSVESNYGLNFQTSMVLSRYYRDLEMDSAALVASMDALNLEPGSSRALSAFFEAESKVRVAKVVVEAKVSNYCEVAISDSGSYFETLYLLGGRIHKSKSAKRTIRQIADSGLKAPVASEVAGRLLSSRRDVAINDELSEQDGKLADLVLNIILGKNTSVFRSIKELPSEVWPVDVLSLAASGERRKGRADAAARYSAIAAIGKGVPNKSKLHKFARALDSARISQEIYTNGFPFSPRSEARPFQSQENRSFYFLHNSLPFNSAGYATRTHGLLSSLANIGWDPEGVTRLGYPSDNYDHDVRSIPSNSRVDAITYHHLVDVNDSKMMKTPVLDYQRKYVRAASDLVLERKPHVLHGASNHWNGLTVAELGRQFNLPTVFEVRGLWEVTRASREPEYFGSNHYLQKAALEADAARACDRVITITNALREEMISRGVSESKITVVPNGVDTERFKPLERHDELYAKLGIEGRTVVGYVGSILDYEGLDLLFQAAQRILSKRSDVVFLIVGDGAAAESLRNSVEECDMEKSFIMTGRVPHKDVESYYSLIDICPFPRRPLPVCEMVSPLKPFEALAMQKSILVSNVAAMAEIIDDGITGLHYEKGDLDDLEEKLTRLISNERLRKALSEAGLHWVRKNRSWNELGRLVGGIYQELGAVPSV